MVVYDNRVGEWFQEPGINDEGLDSNAAGETIPGKVPAALERDMRQAG